MQPDAPTDLTPNFLSQLLPNLSPQPTPTPAPADPPAHPSAHPPADPYAADRATVAAVRKLLAGACPGDLPRPPQGGYGRWAALMCRFYAAWAEGDTPAVEDLHVAAATSDPVYCTLMCGDLPPAPKPVAGAGDETGDAALDASERAAEYSPPAVKSPVQSPEERGWSMGELLLDESAPIEFVIDGLIPVGVTNIAGRPKIGKSWLALQLFVAASLGRPVLGFPTMTGAGGAAHAADESSFRSELNRTAGSGAGGGRIKAYYLALEDSKNRLIDRLKKVAAGMGIDPTQPGFCTGGSRLDNECSPLSEGGVQEVAAVLKGGYKLVIIDTFSRFLGRGDQMDQQKMTLALGTLQRLAFEHHAAVVVVDHHRKSARTSPDADPIDDIMGATAKAGVVDCAIGLYRRHNQNEAALKLCGRDFGDSEIALEWDPDAFCWTRKEAKNRKRDKPPFTLREQEAIDAVGDLGRATLRELATHLGQERSNLYTRLQGLCRRGALECIQTARGCEYVIPTPAAGPISAPAAVAAHAADETWLRSELDERRLVKGSAAHEPAAPVVVVVDVVDAADNADNAGNADRNTGAAQQAALACGLREDGDPARGDDGPARGEEDTTRKDGATTPTTTITAPAPD